MAGEASRGSAAMEADSLVAAGDVAGVAGVGVLGGALDVGGMTAERDLGMSATVISGEVGRAAGADWAGPGEGG